MQIGSLVKMKWGHQKGMVGVITKISRKFRDGEGVVVGSGNVLHVFVAGGLRRWYSHNVEAICK